MGLLDDAQNRLAEAKAEEQRQSDASARHLAAVVAEGAELAAEFVAAAHRVGLAPDVTVYERVEQTIISGLEWAFSGRGMSHYPLFRRDTEPVESASVGQAWKIQPNPLATPLLLWSSGDHPGSVVVFDREVLIDGLDPHRDLAYPETPEAARVIGQRWRDRPMAAPLHSTHAFHWKDSSDIWHTVPVADAMAELLSAD